MLRQRQKTNTACPPRFCSGTGNLLLHSTPHPLYHSQLQDLFPAPLPSLPLPLSEPSSSQLPFKSVALQRIAFYLLYATIPHAGPGPDQVMEQPTSTISWGPLLDACFLPHGMHAFWVFVHWSQLEILSGLGPSVPSSGLIFPSRLCHISWHQGSARSCSQAAW